MRSISLTLKQFSRSFLLVAVFATLGLSARAQGDASKGEAIFKSKCTACHKVEEQMIGPALGPQLVSETDDKWLTKWIQNNQALINAKDQKALAIYNKFDQKSMTVFTDLSDGDVANVIAYIRSDWKIIQQQQTQQHNAAPVEKGPSDIMVYAIIGLIIIALIIVFVLSRVTKGLERVIASKPDLLVSQEPVDTTPVDKYALAKKLLKNKKFVFFVLICVSIAAGSWTWVTLWNTNVHQGYQPVQPIKFPHDLHAGVMKIQCQYCHSGAYKSKNASIPSLNFCMNCHKTVKTESPEVQKIYAALGYDPKTQKYDSTKSRPIQWVRVHNLPDLVYFNHSQHVKVAGIRCQTCHGPVETMKEVYQYSPLTMKWCIQCHKRTEVNYKGNPYYEKLQQVHDLLAKHEKVTEAEMGGIECGKCHY